MSLSLRGFSLVQLANSTTFNYTVQVESLSLQDTVTLEAGG
jgi:hypothetical protein